MKRRTPSRDSKLEQGRGQGHGKDFKPYLTVRDVPSKGLSHRIRGWKTERVHHLLSNHEKHYFYVLEWAPQVFDIREQFPLPLEATVEIAKRLRIVHPTVPGTQELVVMTTDFLIDELVGDRTVLKARTVKQVKDLNSKRIFEKLEIERTYWHEHETDWGIVVDEEIPKDLAKNVEWVHDALEPDVSHKIPPELIPQIEELLYSTIVTGPELALSYAALHVDNALGLRPGTGLWVVRHMIASRRWSVDMFSPISPDKALIIQRAPTALPNGKMAL